MCMSVKIKGAWCLITPNRAKNQNNADSQYKSQEPREYKVPNCPAEKVAGGV